MKKKLSEMSFFERIHHSLEGKTFRNILIITLLISTAAVGFGYFLYDTSVRREYRTRTLQMSRTAVLILNSSEVMDTAERVVKQYESMTEEEREQLSDKKSPLLEKFTDTYGKEFDHICSVLRQIQESNGGMAAFTAFLDSEHNRRVFICDSDEKSSFCPPGSLDVFDEEIIHDLQYGRQYILDSAYGVEKMSATIFRMKPYGYRCMAGTMVGVIDGYPVYVFFDTDMNQVTRVGSNFLSIYIALMAMVLLFVLILSVMHINKTIVYPINQMAAAAQAYIDDVGSMHQNKEYFTKVNINTGDEIENLALTMKQMEVDLRKNIADLTKVTRERARIRTELGLAARIQAAMLPHKFPPFPERKEIDIFATMTPAKEVGGDFYDFFFIDEDHLGIVIADVSGKGIPGALFMMISKIILQSCAMLGKGAAETMQKTNEAICSNNQEEMFVTAWFGILELSTGKLTASNAGHEYPTIRKPNGQYELVKDKHGFIIGGMSESKYFEYEWQLKPGTSIFVYTDGVPEATAASGELFGMDRMVEALNTNPNADPEQVLQNVQAGVDAFVQDAEQFDDLTMLCIRYNGAQKA